MLASSELDSMVYFFCLFSPISVSIYQFISIIFFRVFLLLLFFFFGTLFRASPPNQKRFVFVFFQIGEHGHSQRKKKNKCRTFEISGSISIAKSLFSTLLSFSWFSTFGSLELFRSKKAIGFWDFDVIVWKKQNKDNSETRFASFDHPHAPGLFIFGFSALLLLLCQLPSNLNFFFCPLPLLKERKKKTKTGEGFRKK